VIRWLALLAIIVSACGSQPSNAGQTPATSITVFAAASLQPPFDKIAAKLKTRDNINATFNYAGTQTLTSQLTQGAQADVFASADTAHMTTAQSAGLLAGAPRLFAHNKLEIAVEKGNPKGIHSLADLARSGLVVVLADPSVPAGKYAQQALTKAGVSVRPSSLEPQVTGVLSKVALGEADAGIVYVSDIVTSGKVDGIVIPDSQNVIADYPIATLKGAQNAAGAELFITFLLTANGQAILTGAGFAGV
jgi:molybdate transport system substrate-binding protein